MQDMLTIHVEYKEFSTTIARRSLKIFIEQFDSEKVYLLSNEARPYLEPTDGLLNSVVQKFPKDDLSEYERLNKVLQNSIVRSRNYRQEIQQELIANNDDPRPSLAESYNDFATTEGDLKRRIKNQLLKILLLEKRLAQTQWNPELRKKVFALWEKRYARLENTYLPSTGNGIRFPSAANDHYLCMHTLKSMAKSLDAHTSYFSPEEAFEMRTSLEKQFEGIGVVLRESVDGVIIHDLIKGGPAEKSGKIAAGDLIVEIDGKGVEGLTYEEILKRLQGGAGFVRIGLLRSSVGKAPVTLQVDLKRERIVMQDDRVQYAAEPYAGGIIGKIVLPSFYESGLASSCELDLREALKGLKKQGNLLGLVIDMRDNSGGFLNQAVKVAGLFISSGVVVISKYSQGEMQYLRDLDGRSYFEGPIVILTSKASASAAEIVAQALQDYGTALVVGDERTYGKGTIQYQTVTDSKAASFFKVTVGRYYTVSGRSTQIEGVKADIVVPTAYAALNIGERYLEFPLKSDRIPSAYIDPLTDVDPRNRPWFQKNYLPGIQKKLSYWTEMLPQLKANSEHRLKNNKDFKLFLSALDQERRGRPFVRTSQENWGAEDLQMNEAVHIVKDMAIIKSTQKIAPALRN